MKMAARPNHQPVVRTGHAHNESSLDVKYRICISVLECVIVGNLSTEQTHGISQQFDGLSLCAEPWFSFFRPRELRCILVRGVGQAALRVPGVIEIGDVQS